MIHLEDVRLTLASEAGPVDILRGVDFHVSPGESVGLVGPSGSGKSTLLAITAGLERPTSGRVRVAGQELVRLDEDKLALFRRDSIGILFQAFHLVQTMTALENVAIPLEFAGRADAFERAAAGLGAVGLEARTGHYPAQLSGGEQQRVALARALSCQPSLLLADEPTGNLDDATGAHVIDLMFELCQRHGSTLVLITHDMELAGRCDRIAWMRDGRIGDAAGRDLAAE
ncbi:MAG: ABC transporter ATP-binding protein [Alphaproteobacteria bacterium]|jgi:putative ABC transport system ATP-binding protein|nr:ABC transporter ATP-binding protein [Alphaproteobacteria bacterium]